MQRTWDPRRVMAALSTLKDNGVSVREMTRLSGANRSTIYRWMRDGDGQPDYVLVSRLAQGIWRRWPDLARELVEASGWPWQEPDLEPEPLVAPELAEALRRHVPDDAGDIIARLERAELERRHAAAGGRSAGQEPRTGPAAS